MSGSDLAVAAVVVACFSSLWWCLLLTRRLRRIERTLKLDPVTGLGKETAGEPAAADDIAELLRADGERMRCKREAVGWTRRQLSVVCQESEETIKDLELARSVVAKDIRAKIEACLDAELAQQGLPSKKL